MRHEIVAPRTKAVARPEEPDGVEDVCYDDIVVTVPTQLFKLDGLHQVLNLTTFVSIHNSLCISNTQLGEMFDARRTEFSHSISA